MSDIGINLNVNGKRTDVPVLSLDETPQNELPPGGLRDYFMQFPDGEQAPRGQFLLPFPVHPHGCHIYYDFKVPGDRSTAKSVRLGLYLGKHPSTGNPLPLQPGAYECGQMDEGVNEIIYGAPTPVYHFDVIRNSPNGKYFVDAAGRAYAIRSHSFFLGVRRMTMGENLRPLMGYIRSTTKSNCLDVFPWMWFIPQSNGLPALSPDEGLEAAGDFMDLAASEGFYVHWRLGDHQMWPGYNFYAAVRRLVEKSAEYANRLLLSKNEPWKNGIPDDIYREVPPDVVFKAQGAPPPSSNGEDEGEPYKPCLDFDDPHTNRSLAEEGYKHVRHLYEQHANPNTPRVFFEEPIGYGEVQLDGRRDNNPHAARQATALYELLGLGGTHHCQHGIDTVWPGPEQQKCGQAVGEARAWVDRDATSWGTITRSGAPGEAVKLDDEHALRCIMRLGPERGQVVAVRPKGYVPVAINGWRVESQTGPNGEFVTVVR